MAYAVFSVVFGEQPSASKWNILGTNDAAFNAALTGSGTISSLALSNPYKFSVYRNAAQNITNSETLVQFDAATYDTGSNVDLVTNKGRFTAPVAGFYFFATRVGAQSGSFLYAVFYKNGAAHKFGTESTSSAGSTGAVVSHLMQLAANDYVEVFAETSTTKALDVGATLTYFSGFLLSNT